MMYDVVQCFPNKCMCSADLTDYQSANAKLDLVITKPPLA